MAACYCGSGLEFADCCGPVIEGARAADTAESLMRARYSAFAARQTDFLHHSLHPDHRHDHDIAATERWAKNAQWLALEIVNVQSGDKGDQDGEVEFIAHYKDKGLTRAHHEVSRFQKVHGSWYYVDGDLVTQKTEVRQSQKVGRNDPCPCGSGKKYKKCCGT